jgi:hypothetical protein
MGTERAVPLTRYSLAHARTLWFNKIELASSARLRGGGGATRACVHLDGPHVVGGKCAAASRLLNLLKMPGDFSCLDFSWIFALLWTLGPGKQRFLLRHSSLFFFWYTMVARYPVVADEDSLEFPN